MNEQVIVGTYAQFFFSRDDLLNLRRLFVAGLVLSPLVHVVRRPTWDLSEDLQRYLWSPDETRECSDWKS